MAEQYIVMLPIIDLCEGVMTPRTGGAIGGFQHRVAIWITGR